MGCRAMNNQVVDYYFTTLSPWSFFGLPRLLEMTEKSGATINYKPCNLGAVFSETGGVAFGKRSPARLAYRMMEMKRWKERLGIEFNLEPAFFPFNDALANRVIIAAIEQGGDPAALCDAFHLAVWCDELNMAEESVIQQVASGAGYDGAQLLAAAKVEAIDAILTANSAEAIERSVFGAPTYILNGENFWGQDRLDFLDERLNG
jgi:2-hydroxychromene-2-carboxylate isomerase